MRIGFLKKVDQNRATLVASLYVVEWGGMEWYGVVWSGMEWYGAEWSGMERYE